MLSNIISVFHDRAKEIENHLSLIKREDKSNSNIDGSNLVVMKASIFIMLYNLIEYTIQSSFLGIFEYIVVNWITYNQISEKVKERWLDIEYSHCHDKSSNFFTYQKVALSIVNQVADKKPIFLSREAIKLSWNIDAEGIKELCSYFGIKLRTWRVKWDDLKKVRDKRNLLAHGSLSFSEVWREFTIEEIEEITQNSIRYMDLVLQAINDYANGRLFLVK